MWGWVALFSTLAGLIYGAWVDGTSLGVILLFLLLFLDALGAGLWGINRTGTRRKWNPKLYDKAGYF